MSMNVVYKCDCCYKKVFDKKPDWIEIGSESDAKLYIDNKIKSYGLTMLNKHNPIHLCSKLCLVAFFFGKEDGVIFHNALKDYEPVKEAPLPTDNEAKKELSTDDYSDGE